MSNPAGGFWRPAAPPGARPCDAIRSAGCPTGIEPVPRGPRPRVLPLHHGHRPPSGRGGIRTPMPRRAHWLAPRPGQAVSGSLPSPKHRSGPPGNRTPISGLQDRRLPVGPAARSSVSRPGRTRTCDRPVCKTGAFAAGRRDDLRESPRWDSNPQAPPPQDGGFADLPTRRSRRHCGCGSRTAPIRAYEARPGTGPPASPRPRYRAGRAGLMRPGGAPATPGVKESPVRESNPPLPVEGRASCPMDERAIELRVRRDGVEPPEPEGGWVTATWALRVPSRRIPRTFRAPPMGFEPTVSTVTGWRARPSAPQGRNTPMHRIAREGFEPSRTCS